MKTYTIKYIAQTIDGCMNNDYTMICRAGKLLKSIANGNSINCENNLNYFYTTSLYIQFMRAYTRYITSNPNCIKSIAKDCEFNVIEDDESISINEL